MTRSVFLDRELPLAHAGETVDVTGPVAHHIRVTRIGAEEEFDLVDGAGRRLRCVLAAPAAAAHAQDDGRRSRRRGKDGEKPLRAHEIGRAHV